MIDLLAPWWLTGLLVLPLIWWLHRRPVEDNPAPVSALLLWQNSDTPGMANSPQVETDPLWWLRALIVTLLLLAAANPGWPVKHGNQIEVWFDDSSSMLTQEDDGSRLELATHALFERLTDKHAREVTLHSLTKPTYQLKLTPDKRHQWQTAIDNWLQADEFPLRLPQPAHMSDNSRHWLVSDGADPGYSAWLETSPVAQLIQVGQAHDNTAVSRVSLRPSLDGQRLDGLVVLSHHGTNTTSKQLAISVDGQLLWQRPITLDAGETTQRDFSIARRETVNISVAVTPGDALPSDDELKLTMSNTAPRPYQVQGDCGPRLQAALSSHPMLTAALPETKAALTVVCGATAGDTDTATLWFYRDKHPDPVSGTPFWHNSSHALNSIVLPETGLRHFASPAGDNTVLSAGTAPLIQRKGVIRPLIKVTLDMNSPALIKTRQYPLLVSALIDLALEQNLIDAIDSAQHPTGESDVAPRKLTMRTTKQSPGASDTMFFFAPWLIILALLLLAYDFFITLTKRTGAKPIRHARGTA